MPSKANPQKSLTATQVVALMQERIQTNGGGDRTVLVGTAHVVDVEFAFDDTTVDGNVVLITD